MSGLRSGGFPGSAPFGWHDTYPLLHEPAEVTAVAASQTNSGREDKRIVADEYYRESYRLAIIMYRIY